MTKQTSGISDEIRKIIQTEVYANPFTAGFDSKKLRLEFGKSLSETECATLYFLEYCNALYLEVRKNIFLAFDRIGLNHKDLKLFLFAATNKNLLDVAPILFEQMRDNRVAFDTEDVPFTKLNQPDGSSVNAQLAFESGPDILSFLTSLITEWVPKEQELGTFVDLETEKIVTLFSALSYYASILLSVRNAGYLIVKHEKGIVALKKDGSLKVASGISALQFLNHSGEIRTNGNLHEWFFQLPEFYKELVKKRAGVGEFEVNNNTVSPKIGNNDSAIGEKADSSLFLFYDYMSGIELEQYDRLTLSHLLQLLVLLEECAQVIHRKNISNYTSKPFHETPTRFLKTQLIEVLSEASQIKETSVIKFIDSITSQANEPYLWREPLVQEGDYLYFSIASLLAPNHVLFFDRWTAKAGYDLDSKERLFTEFVQTELEASDAIEHKFEILSKNDIGLDLTYFDNNLLIETTTQYILLEVKLFDFTIEAEERMVALDRLATGAVDVKEKTSQLTGTLDSEKQVTSIILTNYKSFSGLIINDISITDLGLLNNYVRTGELRRVAVGFNDGTPIMTDEGVRSYYKNEVEFNDNFKSFFEKPLPVWQILNRLTLEEQAITPEKAQPKILIDRIDQLPAEELLESKISALSEALNYEYFVEPEEGRHKDVLDEAIIFSLSEIFSKLAYSNYETFSNRVNLYNIISKTKLLGFVHLAFFILKSLEKFNGKPLQDSSRFKTVSYIEADASALLDKLSDKLEGNFRLSEFTIEDNIFSDLEEKQLISLSIDILSGVTPNDFDSQDLVTQSIPLSILYAFCGRHQLDMEFYTACSNLIDALNFTHKYQVARDFCEEVLIATNNINKQNLGWALNFKCYTDQRSHFDASIHGCIFLSSLSVLPVIPQFYIAECLYLTLKYFRNFRFDEFAKHTYENLQNLDLLEYDKQKITLSYFNSFLSGSIQTDKRYLDEVLQYVNTDIENIVGFGPHGVMPWLAFFYNVQKLQALGQFSYEADVSVYIKKLEANINSSDVESIKKKVLGDVDNAKGHFLEVLLNTLETRNIEDFINETQNLTVVTDNLIEQSIVSKDIDGLLLAGLIKNDQQLVFINQYIEPGEVLPLIRTEDDELALRLSNYLDYVLENIRLKPKHLFVWLFEHRENIYSLTVTDTGVTRLKHLEHWKFKSMRQWTSTLGDFYFNSKKGEFNNPRKEYHYDISIQEEDEQTLKSELHYASLEIQEPIEQLMISCSMELTIMPHNLIQYNEHFIGKRIPVCNVVSVERFIEHSEKIYLDKLFTISAWIPVEDQEPIVSWGHKLLEPILKANNSRIFTTRYPQETIKSDLNVFLAHGVTDGSGFKAIYSNHHEKKGIVFPHKVFGSGKIAILFVCNSGSSKQSLFTNSTVSFINELLKDKYESVVAPFWPFDVTMSKIWLEEFFETFKDGISLAEAVWFANHKLTKYDEETSNAFIAPAGCLAMHLYGNPNVFVKAN